MSASSSYVVKVLEGCSTRVSSAVGQPGTITGQLLCTAIARCDRLPIGWASLLCWRRSLHGTTCARKSSSRRI